MALPPLLYVEVFSPKRPPGGLPRDPRAERLQVSAPFVHNSLLPLPNGGTLFFVEEERTGFSLGRERPPIEGTSSFLGKLPLPC